MRIKVLKTFLIGRERHEEGDERTVSEEIGRKAAQHGWAERVDETTKAPPAQAQGEVTLDIHGAAHAAGDSHG